MSKLFYSKKTEKEVEDEEEKNKEQFKKNIGAVGQVEGKGGVGTVNPGGVLSERQTALETEYFHRKNREAIEEIKRNLKKKEEEEDE